MLAAKVIATEEVNCNQPFTLKIFTVHLHQPPKKVKGRLIFYMMERVAKNPRVLFKSGLGFEGTCKTVQLASGRCWGAFCDNTNKIKL